MKKLKVLIADDDHRIRMIIEKILLQNFISVEIVAQTDSVENSINALYKYKPHIAFLDIHLINGTAFEVVRQTVDLDYKVIFMSTYQEYALEDIKFASIDFVYKPIDIDDLLLAVDQAMSSMIEGGYRQRIQTLFQNTGYNDDVKQIVFKTRSSVISVPIRDIVCGESNFGTSLFQIQNRKPVEINQPLRHYESMLNGHNFFRCHSKYIVNYSQITGVNYQNEHLQLANGQIIPFEIRRLNAFTDQLYERNEDKADQTEELIYSIKSDNRNS